MVSFCNRFVRWDQTGSNGANLSFPAAFGIAAKVGEANYVRDGWLVGVVNSAPYISSAVLGTWLSDPLNNHLGRRGVIFGKSNGKFSSCVF